MPWAAFAVIQTAESGGHLKVGEEWSTCAAREVLEETGLQVHYYSRQ